MSIGSNQFGAELIARLRHRREFFARQVLAAEKLSGAAVMAGTMQLPKLVKTALDETRMLVLGAQILLGFELSGIFRDRFETLPMHARYLDGIALACLPAGSDDREYARGDGARGRGAAGGAEPVSGLRVA
jgi:hypothetical protein